jgi:hypothetical protein
MNEEKTMYAAFHLLNGHILPADGGLVPVRTPRDLEYLVKESEVITGKPGRKFVIAGADRLTYRVQWQPNGYSVECLDEADKPICTMYLRPQEFHAHSLGSALRGGFLFTPMLAD